MFGDTPPFALIGKTAMLARVMACRNVNAYQAHVGRMLGGVEIHRCRPDRIGPDTGILDPAERHVVVRHRTVVDVDHADPVLGQETLNQVVAVEEMRGSQAEFGAVQHLHRLIKGVVLENRQDRAEDFFLARDGIVPNVAQNVRVIGVTVFGAIWRGPGSQGLGALADGALGRGADIRPMWTVAEWSEVAVGFKPGPQLHCVRLCRQDALGLVGQVLANEDAADRRAALAGGHECRAHELCDRALQVVGVVQDGLVLSAQLQPYGDEVMRRCGIDHFANRHRSREADAMHIAF